MADIRGAFEIRTEREQCFHEQEHFPGCKEAWMNRDHRRKLNGDLWKGKHVRANAAAVAVESREAKRHTARARGRTQCWLGYTISKWRTVPSMPPLRKGSARKVLDHCSLKPWFVLALHNISSCPGALQGNKAPCRHGFVVEPRV